MLACGLCGKSEILRDSHLLPAAVYRIARDPERRNPNPVVVAKGGALATSSQVSKPFLCDVCEDRFSRLGERIVLAHCAREDGGFTLLDQLEKSGTIATSSDGVRVFDIERMGSCPVEAFKYFAASVIWRAAATDWRYNGCPLLRVPLGPYLEVFRAYLLEREPWPDGAYLQLQLTTERGVDVTSMFPFSNRVDGVWRHTFSIPGIFFHMFIGKHAADEFVAHSLTTPGPKIAFVGGVRGTPLFKGILKLVKSAPAKGSLKKGPLEGV